MSIARIKYKFFALPTNLQGVVWMLMAASLWLCNLSLVKYLSTDFSPAMLSFMRTGLSAFFIVPLIVYQGMKILRFHYPWYMLGRGVFGSVGSVCAYYAVSNLPLSQFNAIVFSKPLFVMVMAFFFLGERFGSRRIIAAFVGFLGVLIIVLPGALEQSVASGAVIAALASAFCFASYNILAKLLTRKNSVLTVLFYSNILVSAFLLSAMTLLPYKFAQWMSPSTEHMPLIIAMALCGVIGQGCYIKALKVGEASFVSNVDFVRLPMTIGADVFIFALLPPAYIWPGAALIIGSLIYISWREARLKGRHKK